MNAKQMGTWKEIVQQCKSRFYSRINVASNVRSDTILAVDALVELVTPELPALLERLAKYADIWGDWDTCSDDTGTALDLATRIREALGETE